VRFHLLEMATTASSSLQIAAARPCISSSRRLFKAGAAILGGNSKAATWNKLTSACHISSVQPFQRSFTSSSIKFNKVATKAMSNTSENKPVSGLPIDLRGQFSLFCFPQLFFGFEFFFFFVCM
jgi:enoyl-[acyl-carrier protein] reductase I